MVHCEKSGQGEKQLKGRASVYYILSVRKGSEEEEPLLEISQDAKESFWVKLSKFVQEFKRIEVLQLRLNHQFGHIDLGVCE